MLVAASSCPLRLWLNGFGSLSQQKGPPPACWVVEVEPFWVLGISLLQTELHSGSPQKGAVVEEGGEGEEGAGAAQALLSVHYLSSSLYWHTVPSVPAL